MTIQILLATGNHKKLAELRRIIAEQHLDLEVLGLRDVPGYAEPAETEWTFEGNALIKARAGVAHTGLPTLADDSGLCVDALNHMPGVRSARWAGPEQEDIANLELVLRQVDDVPADRRQAQFVAVMALVLPDGREFTARGEMSGRLAHAARGGHGFGYDPIFVADDQTLPPGGVPRTNGQLAGPEKDAISHRGKAVRKILQILVGALDVPHQAVESPTATPGTQQES